LVPQAAQQQGTPFFFFFSFAISFLALKCVAQPRWNMCSQFDLASSAAASKKIQKSQLAKHFLIDKNYKADFSEFPSSKTSSKSLIYYWDTCDMTHPRQDSSASLTRLRLNLVTS